MAAASIAALLLCYGVALAGTRAAKNGRDAAVEPGAIPKERARIMGYGGADDPRAAAEKRRDLGTNEDSGDVAKAKRQQPGEGKDREPGDKRRTRR